MRFEPLKLEGAYRLELEPLRDERGFFARTWSADEFSERGLAAHFSQCNLSYNKRKGTLRGLHFQKPPHAEAKLITCIAGAIFDVIVDLRSGSPTFKQWTAVELNRNNRLWLYVPEGFAHGYETLEDDSEVFYQVTAPYAPKAASGVRWNDPALAICWPATSEKILSEKDRSWPDFKEEEFCHASL